AGEVIGKLVARGTRIHALARTEGEGIRLLELDLADAKAEARFAPGAVLPPRAEIAGRTLPDGRIVIAREVSGGPTDVVAIDPESGEATVLFALADGASIGEGGLDVDEAGDIYVSFEAPGADPILDRFSIDGTPRRGEGIEWPLRRALRFSIAAGALWSFGADGEVRRWSLDGRSAPGIVSGKNDDLGAPVQLVAADAGTVFVSGRCIQQAEWDLWSLRFVRRFGGVDPAGISLDERGFVLIAAQRPGLADGSSFIARIRADARRWDPLPAAAPAGRGSVRGLTTDGLRWWVLRDAGDRWSIGTREIPRDAIADPADIAFGATGTAAWLYVADRTTGRVWRTPAAGAEPLALSPVSLPLALVRPTALAAGRDGSLYAGDARGIHAFAESADGWRHLWTLLEAGAGDPFGAIAGLAAAEGSVYATDAARHRLLRFDRRLGVRIDDFGESGARGCDARHLDAPGRVAAIGASIYVADRGNHRVLALAPAGGPGSDALPLEDRLPAARPPLESVAEIAYRLPATGRVSAAIYDGGGRLVRTLVSGSLRTEGPQHLAWDGLDDRGRPVLPGEYVWRVARVPSLEAALVTSVGQSGSPAYRTADGRGGWGSTAGNPIDVAGVGDDLLILWAIDDGDGGLLRMRAEGGIVWRRRVPPDLLATHLAIASDGETAWIAAATPIGAPRGRPGDLRRIAIWRIDARTGQDRPFAGQGLDRYRFFGTFHDTSESGTGAVLRDIAVASGKLYIPSFGDSAIYEADGETGEVLRALPLDRPAGIAIDPEGRIFAIGGDRIVEIDDAGPPRIIAEGLRDPWDLAIDVQGLLYASERGDGQRVSVFSPAGRLLRRIGRAGGRAPRGRFDPEGLLDPAGITIGPDGYLYVAEDSVPRRVLRFSRYGALLREWYGSFRLDGAVAVDPEEPEWIYADAGTYAIRYRVDYETGRWSVDALWPLGETILRGACLDVVGLHGHPAIRRHMGHPYWCSSGRATWRIEEDSLIPAASVILDWAWRDPARGTVFTRDLPGSGWMATWADRNGDGCAIASELVVTMAPIPRGAPLPEPAGIADFDEEMRLLVPSPWGPPSGGIWRVPAAEWLEETIPVYRWDLAVPVAEASGDSPTSIPSGPRIARASDEAVYAIVEAPVSDPERSGRPPLSRLERHDIASATRRWGVGRPAGGFARPGEVYRLTGISGVAGGFVFASDESGQERVWSEDGLFVDSLLDDMRRDPLPGPNALSGASRGGIVFRHPRTGKVYLAAGGDAIHIWEIRGLAPIAPIAGTVRLPADRAAARAAIDIPPRRSCRIARLDREIRVDGDLSDWPDVARLSIAYTAMNHASLRLVHDGTHLYAAFEVLDPTPLANAGESPEFAFRAGDALAIEIGPALGEDRARPVAGDARVLIPGDLSRPAAILFRPVGPGTAKPRVFSSPLGSVRIEEIRPLDDALVAFLVAHNAYTAELSIPLSALGHRIIGRDRTLALDASIFFGGGPAGRTVARARWASGWIDAEDDLPSRIRFEPYLWGTAVFE
ncbi:MAG: hypothetical protein JXP34_05655, partial [Planctomycetes bacterium]|nr:hypothetical protein [Planctomycetota bacterium]